SAEDFLIFEDGKPQKVALFSPGGRRRTAGAPAMGEGATVTGTAVPAPAPTEGGPGRSVAIVVDDLHIAVDHLEQTKRALTQLVEQFTADDDELALVTTSSSSTIPLSPEKARVRWAIGALKAREAAVAPAASSQMTPGQAEMILSGDRSALRQAARIMLEEPGSVYSAVPANSPRSGLERPGPEVGGTGLESGAETLAANDAVRQAAPILA